MCVKICVDPVLLPPEILLCRDLGWPPRDLDLQQAASVILIQIFKDLTGETLEQCRMGICKCDSGLLPH